MRATDLLRAKSGRVRLRGVRTAKVTVAAVLAYVVAQPFSSNTQPILAPLTALLVVQLTLYETLRTGLRRVVSVVAGVLVAVGFSALVHLNWLSLGVIVASSLVIGRLLRLGAELLEVPISAMLVLAVGGSDTAATGRVVETVVGAVVGVAVSVLIAPPLYVRPASDAVQSLARETAEVLRRVAADVRGEYTREKAERWLADARALTRDILRADQALDQAEASLRLNPRALTVHPGTLRLTPEALRARVAGRSLRAGLDALERAVVSLRGLCRALLDRTAEGVPEPVYAEDVRQTLGDLLEDLADAVEAYGALVGSEVLGPDLQEDALRRALAEAWAHRDRLTELLSQEPRRQADAWQLHGELLANIDRLLRDVDAEARARLRESWSRQPDRLRPAQAMRDRLRPAQQMPQRLRHRRSGRDPAG